MKSPEKTFRIGLVSASIFVNDIEVDGKPRQILTANLQRRYRDPVDGEWKSSTSFSLAELPQAITALQLAMNFVAQQEAEVHAG